MKKFALVLMSIFLLFGCSGKRQQHPETVIVPLPEITASQQERETARLEYAKYIAGNEWYERYSSGIQKSDTGFYVGDRIRVFGISNGELVEKNYPYTYPILTDQRYYGCVEILSGDILNLPDESKHTLSYILQFRSQIMPLDEHQMFYQTSELNDYRDNNRHPVNFLSYGDRFILIRDSYDYGRAVNQQHGYVVYDDVTIELKSGNVATECQDNEYTLQARKMLQDMGPYQIHPVEAGCQFPVKEVHIVNSVLSDTEIATRRNRAKQELKSLGRSGSPDQPLNLWTLIVNDDMSVSLIRETDLTLFPLYNRDCAVVFSMDGGLGCAVTTLQTYGIAPNLLAQFNPSRPYLVLSDYGFNVQDTVVVTDDGVVPWGEFPLYSRMSEQRKDYVNN